MPGALEIQTVVLPAIPKLEPVPAAPQDLELLFEEVHALTLRLKQTVRGDEQAAGLLSAAQGILRLLLEQGPKTVPQIARLRGTSRQNVQILVNRLLREGFVALAPNPAHRRSALVTLTARARDALTAVGTAQNGFASTLLSQVTQAEVRSALALLRRLRDSLAGRQSSPAVATAPRRQSQNAVHEGREENPPPPAMRLDEESSSSGYELPVNLL